MIPKSTPNKNTRSVLGRAQFPDEHREIQHREYKSFKIRRCQNPTTVAYSTHQATLGWIYNLTIRHERTSPDKGTRIVGGGGEK